MISMRKSYPELRLIHIHRLVKKFEKTCSIKVGRLINQRLKFARTPAVITKVNDMFAEMPQMSVCKLANSITENASSTSIYRMLRFDLNWHPIRSQLCSILNHLTLITAFSSEDGWLNMTLSNMFGSLMRHTFIQIEMLIMDMHFKGT